MSHSQRRPSLVGPPKSTARPDGPSPAKGWCVPKQQATDAELHSNINYICSQGVDCKPIQPGDACYNPNNAKAHATYAMNTFYQTKGRQPYQCYFSQTAAISNQNPIVSSFIDTACVAWHQKKKYCKVKISCDDEDNVNLESPPDSLLKPNVVVAAKSVVVVAASDARFETCWLLDEGKKEVVNSSCRSSFID
uniref:X8 domain-containing protein n=1 Tax=Chenopodium quinoa TaxID=63459 RepID=A0A803MSN9_CHEQI